MSFVTVCCEEDDKADKKEGEIVDVRAACKKERISLGIDAQKAINLVTEAAYAMVPAIKACLLQEQLAALKK